MHGWLNGKSMLLKCLMEPAYPGFTRLLRSFEGQPFSPNNIGNYNTENADDMYSILELARDIRQLRTGPYQMLIKGKRGEDGGMVIRYDDIPRQEPVRGDGPRDTGLGTIFERGNEASLKQPLSLPFRGDFNPVLIGVKAGEESRSLARTDGRLWGDDEELIVLWIRE